MIKPYLVDIAVKTTIWTRPGIQRRQFEVIRRARPSKLILVSDGGRNEKEWHLIKQNRKMFDEEIDWDCTVYKLYENKNQGVWTMINRGHDFVWSKVEECIFLEDDDIPSVSLFQFCKEMLEKYRDDKRIGFICAFNPLGIYEDCPYDYFFTGQGNIWGIATWKRINESFDLSYGNDGYAMSRMRLNTDNAFWKKIKGYSKNRIYGGHVATDEFFYEMSKISQHQLRIYPKVNLISNVGFDEGGGAHTSDLKLMPKGLRQFYNTKIYEMKFPLKHPRYMVEDKYFEKKVDKLYGYHRPWIGVKRKIERVWLLLIHGQIYNALKLYIRRKNRHIEM